MDTTQFNTKSIVAIGDLVADLIVDIPQLPVHAGQHQPAQTIQLEPGGTCNFLIAGARLGASLATIGLLGADHWGTQVAEMLAADGVDLASVVHAGTTTLVVVLVGEAGEHVFLGHYGSSPELTLQPQHYQQISASGALFVAGYNLLEARLSEGSIEALTHARQVGVPTFFDPGPLLERVPEALRQQALALVDTLLLTEDEFPTTLGIPYTGWAEQGEKLASAQERIWPPTIVVKRGAEGCVLWQKVSKMARYQKLATIDGLPVKVVDTSAAGDCFAAAYIAGTLRGWDTPTCARFANAVGATKVQKLGGGRNVPSSEEVAVTIERFDLKT